MCGGTGVGIPRAAHKGGLSPRVRGNLAISPSTPVQDGSIPACAGEPMGKGG